MQFLKTSVPMPYDTRTLPVDMIVLHYTDTPTAKEALDLLSGAAANASTHYLVDEGGLIYALVPEEFRAWHAGVSCWRGEKDTNSRSIGIEICNPGHSHGYRPFTDKQMDIVMALCREIMNRWHISPAYVLGHSDVAPKRKKDPGEHFPWKLFAEHGLGLWTDDFLENDTPAAILLSEIGYDVRDESAALTAFQRHFYPEAILSPESSHQTLSRLGAVHALFSGTS